MRASYQHRLLTLWIAFWAVAASIAIITAARTVPFSSRAFFWQAGTEHLIAVLLPVVLVLAVAVLARLSVAGAGRPIAPSDLDRLVQLKRAGRWQNRVRPARVPFVPELIVTSAAPTASVPEEGEPLDRLLALKRQRGTYPDGIVVATLQAP